MRRACAVAAGICLVIPALLVAQDYKIAFASNKGIFTTNSQGRDLQRLTADPVAIVSDGAWSPDGKRILFFVFRKSDAALEYKYNLPLHFPMYAMDPDGKNQKRLLNVPVLPDAKWSPDGKSILFTSSFEGDARRRAVYILDVATGQTRRLTELGFNGSASWSPDGKKIAFSAGARPRDICVVNADGANLKQLTNLGMITTNPVWSPDGRTIAFLAEGWFLMDANGANQKRVGSIPGVSALAWSPDSKHVVVTGQNGAYVWNIGNGTSKALPIEGGRILEAVFSPDGRKVIYRAHEGPQDKMYVVNADGSDRQTLNDNMGEHALFAVSPVIR